MKTKQRLDRYLNDLNTKLLEMSGLIDDSMTKLIKLVNENAKHLFDDIMENEKQVDEYERTIEALCLKIILKEQPVASDLRFTSAALKIITDFERISDQCCDIARIVYQKNYSNEDKALINLKEIGILSKEMVINSTLCFCKNDAVNANDIIKHDQRVNDLLEDIKKIVVDNLKTGDNINVDDEIDILLVAKYFEKISDHSKNVCEWVIFNKTGVHKDKEII